MQALPASVCLTTCLPVCQSPSSGFGDAASWEGSVTRNSLCNHWRRFRNWKTRLSNIQKKTVKIEKGLETKHFPKNIDTLA